MELLRKKDLEKRIGKPRTTINGWISDYNMYIPQTEDGKTTYFTKESVEVLLKIKELKEKGLEKPRIFEELQREGFTIQATEILEVPVSTDVFFSEDDNFQIFMKKLFENTASKEEMQVLNKLLNKIDGRMTDIELEGSKRDRRVTDMKKTSVQYMKKVNELERNFSEIKERTNNEDEKYHELAKENVALKTQLEFFEKKIKDIEDRQYKQLEKKSFFQRLFGK
ncbi:MerR family transcriptional regulator [Bacillus cereus group sp. TH260-2LC]|uniref:MerR family transcriptional regulator n=1 Tax=Bacillus cereus group TaxID=86661 RepID=UPI0011A55233|nr:MULTISPECIES: MerR family transcriptional regulator [Bacillus cereus group]MDA1531999.1 MerR family transcriptional regulator [Bacillus cereus group sp. TH260-2LC]